MSLNHRLMYTGSTDGLAKCWVTEHGDNTVTYKGHGLSVTVVKFYKGLGIKKTDPHPNPGYQTFQPSLFAVNYSDNIDLKIF